MKRTAASRAAGTVLLVMGMLLASCGGGQPTLSEYVESLETIFDNAEARYATLLEDPRAMVMVVGQGAHFGFDAGGLELSDFSTQDLHMALGELAALQDEVMAAAAEIEPPEELAALHALYFRRLPIEPLAARAGSTDSWEELSVSDEMKAYRQALVADGEVCNEFQSTLDATAARGAFSDAPWIPDRLKEIVDFAFGCDAFPADPGDVFRP